jgi:hypothetical protein
LIEYTEIPEEVWEDLRYEINRNNLEFADNFRAYRLKDGLFYEDWMEKVSKGCCGFFETFTVVKGETWVLGCNYGH